MRHALAPTKEGSAGKGVITDDWVTVIEGLIEASGLPISKPGGRKRLKWHKGEGMGESKVQSPDIPAARNPIKLYVRVAERNLSSQFPRRITKNYCAWSNSKNRDLLYERRIPFLTLQDSIVRNVLIITTVADSGEPTLATVTYISVFPR